MTGPENLRIKRFDYLVPLTPQRSIVDLRDETVSLRELFSGAYTRPEKLLCMIKGETGNVALLFKFAAPE